MRARSLTVLAVLLPVAGFAAAGCAPSLAGSGEGGGTIHQLQLRWDADEVEATAMAADYCRQFGRTAHIAGEELGVLWTDTLTFDCVK
ncbi:MAG TPA: hypothetical protein VLX85_08260 [Stellaceae bacterium]|nr:hypothetical protein [Stellaceae bacterium]